MENEGDVKVQMKKTSSKENGPIQEEFGKTVRGSIREGIEK